MTNSELDLFIVEIEGFYHSYRVKIDYERGANHTDFTLRFVFKNTGYVTRFSLPFGKENILKNAVNKSVLSIFAKELGTTV